MNDEFKSKQVFPGRNNSGCVIEFFLPQEAIVTLSILNEHGKNCKRVIEKVKFDPGTHEVEVEHDTIAGSIYFYRLSIQTDRQEIVDTKRIFFNTIDS